MARLIAPLLVIAVVWAAPAHAESVSRWQAQISEASLRFGIPEDWIIRVMRAESSGQTVRNGKPIRSRVGAMGLMQIMPGTWAELTLRYSLGSNPDDPRANILGGTAYLREMYDQFGYPGLFAAYNAGPGRYTEYRSGRSRLPRETIAYVAGITGNGAPAPSAPLASASSVEIDQQIATISPTPTLFFSVKSQPQSPTDWPGSSPPSTLFVALKTAQRGSE